MVVLQKVAFWNVALTAADVAVLATGVCPLLVDLEALVAYIPCIGQDSPETTRFSGATFAVDRSRCWRSPAYLYSFAGSSVWVGSLWKQFTPYRSLEP